MTDVTDCAECISAELRVANVGHFSKQISRIVAMIVRDANPHLTAISRSVLIGVGFFFLGSVSDFWLQRHVASLSVALLDDALVGIGAGLLVFICERKQAKSILVHKQGENTLQSLSGRLIAGQEEERQHIAREIHDDYSQRVAMLAFDLEKLASEAPSETGHRLHEILDSVSELGIDLHSLSHHLHSSTLESLGLVAGIKGFCEEFSQRQGLKVNFVSASVPPDVPKDAALCLFRIAQEGLHNVKKHSGAHQTEVRLEHICGMLRLTIADEGIGFDPDKLPPEHGIGLQSMRERLQLQGGYLEIHSKPGKGTIIDAWLPLKVVHQRAMWAALITSALG